MLTKAQQTEHYLRNAIRRGRWMPGDKMPGEYELIEELGVSRATLRDALNVLSTEGMIIRKSGSGTYLSDEIATGTIAIMANAEALASKEGYVHHRLWAEARQLIESAGYRAVLAVGSGNYTEDIISSMDMFDNLSSSNLIGVLNAIAIGPLERELSRRGIPSVTMGGAAPNSTYCAWTDHEIATSLATTEMLSHGITDFAIMHFELPNDKFCEPNKLITSALQHRAVHNRMDRLIPVRWSADAEDAYTQFIEWWKRPNRPDTMFFYDDSICDVACQAILELGINIPNDLKVIVLTPAGRRFPISVELTRVEFDSSETAAAAWGILHQLIRGLPVSEPMISIKATVSPGGSLGSV